MKFGIRILILPIFSFLVVVMGVIQYSDLSKGVSAGSSNSFNFVAAGDWGCENDAKETFTMMTRMQPELYLGLGDYSYEPSLDCWFEIVESAGSALKVIVGNHDTEGSLLKTLLNKFDLTRQYYSFDYENAHFLGLSSELNLGEDEGQFKFAEADLSKAKSNPSIDWIVVYFHQPFYSGGGQDNAGMREMYHPLFQEYGVDLVLTAHTHNYQRSYPLKYNEDKPTRPLVMNQEQSQYVNTEGTVFTIVGTGGKSIDDAEKKPYLASIYEGFGCLNVQISDKSMSAEFYAPDGSTIDRFELVKNQDQNSTERIDSISSIQEGYYFRPVG